MMLQVIFHEGRDEIITVIVAFVSAKFEIDRLISAGSLKKVRMQFLFEKLIV